MRKNSPVTRTPNISRGLIDAVKKDKWQYGISFFTMVIGILLGFQLQGFYEQTQRNNATEAKIKLFLIELDENSFVAKNYLHSYDNQLRDDSSGFFLKFDPLGNSASAILLEDENVFNVLDMSQVALIRGYIRLVNIINKQRDNYNSMILTGNAKFSMLIDQSKNNVIKNSVSIIAYKEVMDQEFVSIFRTLPENNTKLKNIYKRMEDIENDLNTDKSNRIK